MDQLSRLSLSFFAMDKAASLAELGIGGAGLGAGLGAAKAPRGHRGEGAARGAGAGLGTGIGVGGGAVAGGLGGGMLASLLTALITKDRGMAVGAGRAGMMAGAGIGGVMGGDLGYRGANKLMGAPSWDQGDDVKSAAAVGGNPPTMTPNGMFGRMQDMAPTLGGVTGGATGALAGLLPMILGEKGNILKRLGLGGAGAAVGTGLGYGGGKLQQMLAHRLTPSAWHMTPPQQPSVKSAQTKAAIAGLVILMRDEEGIRVKSASSQPGGRTLIKSAGIKSLITGAGKMLGGHAMQGVGSTMGSVGRSLATSPHAWGAGVGAIGGGVMGSNEDNSWGDTFRNMGVGAGVGAAAGHFGSAPLGQAMQRGSYALNGALGSGVAPRMIASGANTLNYTNRLAQGAPGMGGWLGRNITPDRINAASGIPGSIMSHTWGKNSMPWAIGGAATSALAIPGAMHQGGEMGANEAAAQMAYQYQNMPFMQRAMLAFSPDAMTERLPAAAQQRLQQLRSMAPAA